MNKSTLILLMLALLICLCSCGTERSEAGEEPGGAGSGKGVAQSKGSTRHGDEESRYPVNVDGKTSAAVPVEVTPVIRRSISSYIETNGTLEAENEVDVVARAAGPITELLVEEGDQVTRGQTLARLEDREYRAQLEISRVTLNETKMAFDRAKNLQEQELISPETYEEAFSAYETAKARYEVDSITLGYTDIQAPFDGLVIRRYVNFAEQVGVNTPLFRISDFDPLLCPIQVPERELPRLVIGQSAYLTVEPFPDERFEAAILRISPVVDASTGTIKVTLAVRHRGKLRPGMFARVFLETATRSNAMVIPKAALSLDSIGDTVYVAAGTSASRREVTLGYREGDFVEVLSGLDDGDLVIVIGHDGLSDGTPIQILKSAADDSK
jgi:membrane fusion protein (multidrug efflux system)